MEEIAWNKVTLNPNKGRKRVKREQRMDEIKKISIKMIDLNLTLSIVTLKCKCLSTTIKSHRL